MATDPNDPKVKVYNSEDGSESSGKPAKTRRAPTLFITVAVIILLVLLLTYLF